MKTGRVCNSEQSGGVHFGTLSGAHEAHQRSFLHSQKSACDTARWADTPQYQDRGWSDSTTRTVQRSGCGLAHRSSQSANGDPRCSVRADRAGFHGDIVSAGTAHGQGRSRRQGAQTTGVRTPLRWCLVIALLCAGCGSDIPTPTVSAPTTVTVPVAPAPVPIAPATLVSVGSLSVPGCDALIQLAASVGLATANCKQFTGLLQNTGSGCAANVRGTTVVYADAAGNTQVSAGGWTYSSMVKSSEQIAYSGGALSIPTKQWYWRTTASWDNVRCP